MVIPKLVEPGNCNRDSAYQANTPATSDTAVEAKVRRVIPSGVWPWVGHDTRGRIHVLLFRGHYAAASGRRVL